MENSKQQAVDVMRHIAAAFNLGAEEIADVIPTTQQREKEATPDALEIPEGIKRFLRDMGFKDTGAGGVKTIPLPFGGVCLEIDASAQEQPPTTPKSANALRVEMQSVLDFARRSFEETKGCNLGTGFNPECFSTLMMAYRYAIETQSIKEE